MIDDPISNPASQPASAVPPISPSVPNVGPEGAEPRPFELPSGPAEKPQTSPQSDMPSPMDVARDAAHSQGWSQEDIQDNMKKLQTQLSNAQNQLQNPNVTNKFSDDHYTALNRLTEKMNPDLRSVAKLTDGQFQPATQSKGESALNYVLKWIGGAQDTMAGALAYASTIKNPNPADMMRLQFAMHRATERGELFSSIIGSTVSGIKTIMSAQLG